MKINSFYRVKFKVSHFIYPDASLIPALGEFFSTAA